jgi:transposase-like protein
MTALLPAMTCTPLVALAYTKRRGKCRHCGRTFSLNRDGKLRRHGIRDTLLICPGSGGWPV